MDTDPQRALSILDSINFENFKTKKLKAKHALLYSIALDKNFIDMTISRGTLSVETINEIKELAKKKLKKLNRFGMNQTEQLI